MKAARLRFCFTFLVFFYSNAVIANSSVTTLFEYYAISPKTKYDIKSEMQRNTPIIKKGAKFHGSTSWQVEWNISWKKNDNICYLTASEAKLNVLIKMPKISPNADVSDAVLSSFNNFYAALLNHENGHVKNGIDALRDIDVLLANFNSYSDCIVLNKIVKSSITKIIRKYKHQDMAYDTKTKHGKLQGVSIKSFM
jgi:predicted secreted Zn-dependent protease